MPTLITTSSTPMIEALRSPGCYPHRVNDVHVLETHISWILLTGMWAYKIKKPVNLGFLDFTNPDARRHFCEEELRLNRRLAPSIYDAVVTLNGSANSLRINGNGPVIDYAVRMREFPQDALASNLLAHHVLSANQIETLAAEIARFHAAADAAAPGTRCGAPETAMAAARENLASLAGLLQDAADRQHIDALAAWTEREYGKNLPLLTTRHAEGRVRECHGDLHLDNIVMLDGHLVPFDCIEFSPSLRWTDAMSDVAFLTMDLLNHDRHDFAFRFLNTYLEHSGDYQGLAVLRFHLVYRALVRAKVHGLRTLQGNLSDAERARLGGIVRNYMDLAQSCADDARESPPAIILMHGVSGSGKSVLAQQLAERIGAIRLRSDVERKRLTGLAPLARSESSLAAGLYTSDLTAATHDRLLRLVRVVTNAGYAAIVDATFLKREHRALFRHEARNRNIPFVIVDVSAPETELRRRIAERLSIRGDASEANLDVLARQLVEQDPLDAEERNDALYVDTATAEPVSSDFCNALLTRINKPVEHL